MNEFAKNYKNLNNGSFVKITSAADSYSSTQFLSSLQYATSKGSIVVMAAGNDGNPVPTNPANLAVKTDTKGNLLLGGRAVIVGAVDNNNNIASFSNRAGNICQNFVNNVCKDTVQIKDYFLVAPGGGLIWAANANAGTNLKIDQGTSLSAAFVSGGIAVIKQAWPTLKPEQIVQVLLKTATDLGKPGVDEVYGNGLMNLDAATKPIGALTLAKITNTSTTQIAAGPVSLSSSGLSGGIITKQSFVNSSVLQNTQVIDSIGRNFTVNMTNGMTTSMQNYNPISAFSTLSNSTINYVDLGTQNLINTVYSSDNVTGMKFGYQLNDQYRLSVEVGTAKEFGSILGTKGNGAFALGDSSTNWTGLELSKNMNQNVNVYGSLAYGFTKSNTVSDSLISDVSDIVTQTWTLGLQKKEIFNEKDYLNFQVTELPAIVSGSATISGVTGYTSSNVTEDGATVTSINSKEKIELSNSYRQYATSLAYTQNFNKLTRLQTGLVLQSDNAGSDVKSSLFAVFKKMF
ncbi:MAG: hypothetical protein EBU90_24485 [Proteobacteria bacterium]|nr:hypothetical protein [Pseudomonadota bacterium]